MKYAIETTLDQTYGFMTDTGSFTTQHPEAKLWDTREEALKARSLDPYPDDCYICEVPDEAAFRAQPDTW